MTVTFKDYILISAAFEEAQLDEGAIWDAIKKKLSGKAKTDDEIAAEIDRLKNLGPAELKAIKQTKQSRDFHARRAGMKPRPTRPTIRSPQSASGGRAAEIDWVQQLQNEDMSLSEAKEFIVVFTQRGGSGAERRARLAAKDVTDVRRKFADTYFGKKIISVEPAKPRAKVLKPALEETVLESSDEFIIQLTKTHEYPRAGKKVVLDKPRLQYFSSKKGQNYFWGSKDAAQVFDSKSEAQAMIRELEKEDFNIYPNGGMGKANGEEKFKVEIIVK